MTDTSKFRVLDDMIFDSNTVTRLNKALPQHLQVSHLFRASEGDGELAACMEKYPRRNNQGELLQPILPEPEEAEHIDRWIARAADRIIRGVNFPESDHVTMTLRDLVQPTKRGYQPLPELRNGWTYSCGVICVVCPNCGFTFAAKHHELAQTEDLPADMMPVYLCPSCEE